MNFSDRVDALNWLSELGWEYCSSTTKVSGASDGGTSSRETWILKYCVNGLTKEQIDSVYLQFNVREQ